MKKDKMGREIPVSLEEKKEAITEVISLAVQDQKHVHRRIISLISNEQITDLRLAGVDITDEWVHSIETSAIIHVKKQHGNSHLELKKGQIAITDDDLKKIPEILDSYDSVKKSDSPSRSTGNTIIIYQKTYEDGTIYYLEEKRDGRKSLAFHTMYKKLISPTG